MKRYQAIGTLLAIALLGSLNFADPVSAPRGHVDNHSATQAGVDAFIQGVSKDEAFRSVDALRQSGAVSAEWVIEFKHGYNSQK